MKSNKLLKKIAGPVFVLIAALLAGCSNDPVSPTANSINSGGNLTLSIISDETVTDANEIVITEAKCLIGEVELETEPSSESIHLQISPFAVNLNSLNTTQLVASVNIPEGTYNKIKFQIHKPEDNETPPDPEFKTGESGSQRFSVIVKGIYNGNSFVYKSRKTANVVFPLNNSLVMQQGSRNLTMIVNPSLWFHNGSSILDPGESSNENQIDDNIKSSFRRIIRDDNRDGQPDDN